MAHKSGDLFGAYVPPRLALQAFGSHVTVPDFPTLDLDGPENISNPAEWLTMTTCELTERETGVFRGFAPCFGIDP
jgi:hypothetical protein